MPAPGRRFQRRAARQRLRAALDVGDAADRGAVLLGRASLLHPAVDSRRYNLGRCTRRGSTAGRTIAIVDSFGSDTIAHDLHVFNQAFSLPPMCGEEDVPVRRHADVQPPRVAGLTGDEGTAAEEQRHRPRGQGRLGAGGLPRRRDRARDRARGEHPARHDPDGGDARSTGLPADDERRGVRRRTSPGRRDLPELRLGGGGIRQHAVAGEPAPRVPRRPRTASPCSARRATPAQRTHARRRSRPAASIPCQTVEWPASTRSSPGSAVRHCARIAATSGRSSTASTRPRRARHPRRSGRSAASPPAAVSAASSPGRTTRRRCRPAARRSRRARAASPTSPAGEPANGRLVYISLPPDGNSGLICGGAPCSTGWYDIGGTSLSCPSGPDWSRSRPRSTVEGSG